MIKNFTFFVGLPGCGKSTYINSNFKHYVSYKTYLDCKDTYVNIGFIEFAAAKNALGENMPIIIAADDIKESLNGYDPNAAYKVHQESVDMAKQLVFDFADSRLTDFDIILDGGGINNHYNQDIIEYVRKACPNCHIKMVVFDTPIEICLSRLEKRERKVPIDNIYDKNLRMISCINRYRKLIDEEETIPYYTNKYILLDMDGTIAGYGGGKRDIDGNTDMVNSELFRYLLPVQHMIDFVKQNFDLKNVYICTACANNFVWEEKQEWLDEHFPEIPKENRLWCGNKDYKHVFVKHLAIRKGWKSNEMTLIDDLHDTINKCRKLGINCVHPSNIYSMINKNTLYSR